MYDFTYYIPTKVFFGKTALSKLPGEMKQDSDNILLVYGGGSIKRNGIYDDVVKALEAEGIGFAELGGVEPNPRVTSVRKGAELCREKGLGAVLAIGGGSTIDCAKAIAAAVYYPGDPWDIIVDGGKMTKALPIYAVSTAAATGSEMDNTAVISNLDTNDKLSVSNDCMLPRAAVLNPEYTFSVPKSQTAAGTTDIMSHTLENYFSRKLAPFQDRMAEGILRACVECGKKALEEPEDYDARANLMWAASWAMNGLLDMGKGDAWSVHQIEHFVSAYSDIAHGVGLAILTPNWMRHVLGPETESRFAVYGRNVWGIDPTLSDAEAAELAIEKTRECFDSFGLPSTLSQVGIDNTNFDAIAEKAAARGLWRAYVPLYKEDILDILNRSL